MGNIFGSKNNASENNLPTPQIVALTNEDVEIIKRTWKIPCENPHDSASLIFYTFLERYPHNQQQFASFKDKPLADLKNTVEFRTHSSRIFNVFSSVIDGLDKDADMKGIKKVVADVGKYHAKRRVTKKSHNEVRTVIVEILTDVCKLDDEGKAAWTKLLDIFFHIMFECIDGRSEQFY